MAADRGAGEHDVVVFGATGFVGRLTAACLAWHAPAGSRVALAGRSGERLARVRGELGEVAAGWPLVVADSGDLSALDELAASTRVVARTVGPYLRCGLALVEACAPAGTHYADLAGETLFMRRAIDAADDAARASGARIVHACGFDSIPSDLGVLLLHEYARARDVGDLEDTTLVVTALRGGISGGTIDSLRNQLDELRRDAGSRRTVLDPYALSPDRGAEPDLGPERDPVGPLHDERLGGWLAPFVMGSVNTRGVRRSNALLGFAYGRRLRYRELLRTGGLPLGPAKAAAVCGGVAALAAGLSLPPTRMLLDRVLPRPGEGPGKDARQRGFFKIETHADTSTGNRIICRIAAQGDPGYNATAGMLGESALALALDANRLPDRAGVLTPATAMGDVLVQRLRAGVTRTRSRRRETRYATREARRVLHRRPFDIACTSLVTT